jgi:hypothetical protein
MGQISINLGEIIKKLIPVFGGKARQRATQATLPPHCAWIQRLLHVEKHQTDSRSPESTRRIETRRKGKREKYCVSLIT